MFCVMFHNSGYYTNVVVVVSLVSAVSVSISSRLVMVHRKLVCPELLVCRHSLIMVSGSS